MAFFRKSKKDKKKKQDGSSKPETSGRKIEVAAEKSAKKRKRSDPQESSPQRVGVVSSILTTSASIDSEDPLRFGSVVERRLGRGSEGERKKPLSADTQESPSSDGLTRPEPLRAIEGVLDEEAESPKLEVDLMAHIGHATTITGNIVAEEDLEIQGTIEGAVRLANHRLTVGSDGIVRAAVEAHTVLVIGKITGDVVATELVEIKAGGVIGGDVKAPRIIMNDGAIVVGGLDMSAALPSSGTDLSSEPLKPERPKLMRVELPDESTSEMDKL